MPDETMTSQQLRGNEHETLVAEFWRFSTSHALRSESERLISIHYGLPPNLYQALRETFQLNDKQVEALLNASISTLHRRRREGKNLNSVASERLDRIATMSQLAMMVFEDKPGAINWLTRSNGALGGQVPIMHCKTEIGAKQVRRVLYAMKCGGVV